MNEASRRSYDPLDDVFEAVDPGRAWRLALYRLTYFRATGGIKDTVSLTCFRSMEATSCGRDPGRKA